MTYEPTKQEPVAWQERHFFPKVGEWTHWYDCRPRMADYPREQIEQNGVRYQWRPLYPAPPEDEALRRENERLRDELRQSSIDITRAEVERLREALTVAAKAELFDPDTGIIDADVLEIVQDTARAALQGETAIWAARHDPRE